jgi:hypothetical protein
LQALLIGQKGLLEKHRVEVAPTLEEITDQGKKLAETNKLLTDLRETVKTLPAQVKTEIAPDLNGRRSCDPSRRSCHGVAGQPGRAVGLIVVMEGIAVTRCRACKGDPKAVCRWCMNKRAYRTNGVGTPYRR